MRPVEPRTNVQEVVIVRRRHDGEDGGHRGAWKIAFADFMTALMTFFLVMWLISSTDKKTLQSIAAYFNPIKLTDKVARTKGVKDMEPGAASDDDAQNKTESPYGTKPPADAVGGKNETREDVLFKDPFGVLMRLAKEAEVKPKPVEAVSASAQGLDHPMDPFLSDQTREPRSANSGPSFAKVPVTGLAENLPQAANVAEANGKEEAVRAVKAELAKALKNVPAEALPDVEVAATKEGLLISLTDNLKVSMFNVGSSVPSAQTVVIMEQVAGVLSGLDGKIVVRGHTDARPYKTGGYGNWRLSTDRAHMAYYMLLRGKVDDKRVLRIEGYADRHPRTPADPNAAENRRIEILLVKEET